MCYRTSISVPGILYRLLISDVRKCLPGYLYDYARRRRVVAAVNATVLDSAGAAAGLSTGYTGGGERCFVRPTSVGSRAVHTFSPDHACLRTRMVLLVVGATSKLPETWPLRSFATQSNKEVTCKLSPLHKVSDETYGQMHIGSKYFRVWLRNLAIDKYFGSKG